MFTILFQFNPLKQLRENDVDYNKHPSVDDKVHCLVTVVSADKITFLPEDLIKKMTDIMDHATEMGSFVNMWSLNTFEIVMTAKNGLLHFKIDLKKLAL